MHAPLIRYYSNLVELPAKTELLLLVGPSANEKQPPRLCDVTKRSARVTPYARLRYPSSPPSLGLPDLHSTSSGHSSARFQSKECLPPPTTQQPFRHPRHSTSSHPSIPFSPVSSCQTLPPLQLLPRTTAIRNPCHPKISPRRSRRYGRALQEREVSLLRCEILIELLKSREKRLRS